MFISSIQSYDCKELPASVLLAEKKAEVVFLYVFRIGFPAPLFLVLLIPLYVQAGSWAVPVHC